MFETRRVWVPNPMKPCGCGFETAGNPSVPVLKQNGRLPGFGRVPGLPGNLGPCLGQGRLLEEQTRISSIHGKPWYQVPNGATMPLRCLDEEMRPLGLLE